MNRKWLTAIAILLVVVLLTACSGRQEKAEADYTTIRFKTTDLDGNVVKSEDLFKGHRLTMVNYPMITRETPGNYPGIIPRPRPRGRSGSILPSPLFF